MWCCVCGGGGGGGGGVGGGGGGGSRYKKAVQLGGDAGSAVAAEREPRATEEHLVDSETIAVFGRLSAQSDRGRVCIT